MVLCLCVIVFFPVCMLPTYASCSRLYALLLSDATSSRYASSCYLCASSMLLATDCILVCFLFLIYAVCTRAASACVCVCALHVCFVFLLCLVTVSCFEHPSDRTMLPKRNHNRTTNETRTKRPLKQHCCGYDSYTETPPPPSPPPRTPLKASKHHRVFLEGC